MQKLLAVVAVAIALLTIAATLADPTHVKFAASVTPLRLNELHFSCQVNSVQAVDPVASYGLEPSAHSHTQGGATVFSANETLADMLSAPATTCPIASDRTSFWFPTPLKPDGTPATVVGVQYWLTNMLPFVTPTDPAAVSQFDPGLRFIRGDHACAVHHCKTTVYQCRQGATGSVDHPMIPTPTECGNAAGFFMIQYQVGYQCWDGASLGEGLGDGKPANVIGVNIVRGSNGVCPASNPVTIPGIAVVVQVAADGYGGCLSSDITKAGGQPGDPCSILAARSIPAGASGHADWIAGLPADTLAKIDAGCLNPDFNVGTHPLGTGARNTCNVRSDGSVTAYNPQDGRFDVLVTGP